MAIAFRRALNILYTVECIRKVIFVLLLVFFMCFYDGETVQFININFAEYIVVQMSQRKVGSKKPTTFKRKVGSKKPITYKKKACL